MIKMGIVLLTKIGKRIKVVHLVEILLQQILQTLKHQLLPQHFRYPLQHRNQHVLRCQHIPQHHQLFQQHQILQHQAKITMAL